MRPIGSVVSFGGVVRPMWSQRACPMLSATRERSPCHSRFSTPRRGPPWRCRAVAFAAWAQIGVLKALASQGLQPDLVVGTSVGAVIGGLSAAGCPPEEIERAALDIDCARATVLIEGEAADAVVSSAAIPGFFRAG